MSANIFVGKYRIIFNVYDSKNEMKEVLTKCKNGFLTLEEPESHSYYSILKYRLCNENEWFGIGICSETPTFPPSIVICHDNASLLIGYNNHVAMLNLDEGCLKFDYVSESALIFLKYHHNTIIVLSELSVVQLGLDGNVLTKFILDDVLESFDISDERIICRTEMSSCNCLLRI